MGGPLLISDELAPLRGADDQYPGIREKLRQAHLTTWDWHLDVSKRRTHTKQILLTLLAANSSQKIVSSRHDDHSRQSNNKSQVFIFDWNARNAEISPQLAAPRQQGPASKFFFVPLLNSFFGGLAQFTMTRPNGLFYSNSDSNLSHFYHLLRSKHLDPGYAYILCLSDKTSLRFHTNQSLMVMLAVHEHHTL